MPSRLYLVGEVPRIRPSVSSAFSLETDGRCTVRNVVLHYDRFHDSILTSRHCVDDHPGEGARIASEERSRDCADIPIGSR
jgi:hypothetical protein